MLLGCLGGLNYALWGGSHASGASFLHNSAIFFVKLCQNCKIRAPKRENRRFVSNRLISTNFGAGSSNLVPEWRETAGNPDFAIFFAKLRQNCKIRAPKKGKIENRPSQARVRPARTRILRNLEICCFVPSNGPPSKKRSNWAFVTRRRS